MHFIQKVNIKINGEYVILHQSLNIHLHCSPILSTNSCTVLIQMYFAVLVFPCTSTTCTSYKDQRHGIHGREEVIFCQRCT